MIFLRRLLCYLTHRRYHVRFLYPRAYKQCRACGEFWEGE
jgi:hypothetical protein